MRIAICDDDASWNRHASSVLREYLAGREKPGQNKPAEILCFETGEDFLSYEGPPIHLVFMDIEFDEEHDEAVFKGDGIAFATKVNERWKDCMVAYCTNYLYYALDVYDTDHVYYIVKSQFEDRLDSLFDKMDRVKERESASVYFHVIGSGMAYFALKDVIYFERKTRYTEIRTAEESFHIREKIPDIMEKIPSGIFTRCHSSYLVNMEHILKRDGNSYVLKSGGHVPVSRSNNISTREDFLIWCEKQVF
ncbi:MAG: response regulator transcription factor [Eubacterium sp.]|nr:response regulator transcription factor [Eubacterium sp.]